MKDFKYFLAEAKIPKVGDAMRDTSGRASDFEATLAAARKQAMDRDSKSAKSMKSELEKAGIKVGKIKDNAIMVGDYVVIVTSPGGNVEACVNLNGKEVKNLTGSSEANVVKQLQSTLKP